MTISEAQTPPTPPANAGALPAQGVGAGDVARMQQMLLQLIQLLTPLTTGTGPGEGGPLSIPVQGKTYDPPGQRPDVLTRQPVRLLPSLQQMQREVAQLIAVLEGKPEVPEGEGTENKQPTPNAPTKSASANASTQPTVTKQVFQTTPFSPRAQPSPSLQKPAEKAIAEVRSVIRFLSTSTNLTKPSPETLHSALKQMQPTLNQFVKTVETTLSPKPPTRPSTESHTPSSSLRSTPPTSLPRPVPPPQELPELSPSLRSLLAPPTDSTIDTTPVEPKLHGPVPMQHAHSVEERRRRERKKAEKGFFWEEEKQQSSTDDEEEEP